VIWRRSAAAARTNGPPDGHRHELWLRSKHPGQLFEKPIHRFLDAVLEGPFGAIGFLGHDSSMMVFAP
jgi:hypothetical protein